MRDLNDYIETAKRNLGLTSDHTLAYALNLSKGAVNQWRTARAWPDDETMVKLAEFAGAPADLALLQLHSWKRPEIAAWRTALAKIQRTAAAILVALAFLFSNIDDGNAAAPASGTGIHIDLHYATCLKAWLARAWAAIKAFFTLRCDTPALAN